MSDKVTRMKPEARRDKILAAALDYALINGYSNITRDGVAAHAGVAKGQIHHAFNTMNQLNRAVMRAAVHRELLPIVAHGIASGCSIAHNASQDLKHRATQWMLDNPPVNTDDDGE